jgi:hypothetical protein
MDQNLFDFALPVFDNCDKPFLVDGDCRVSRMDRFDANYGSK